MRPAHLRRYVISPVLNFLNLYSPDAEDLLVGISCAESNCGEFLSQHPQGPALGIYQVELASANDVLNYLLMKRVSLYEKVMSLATPELSLEDNLRGNLLFATAVARCFFLRFPEQIPSSREGKAEYWKKYYNTLHGKGSKDGFLRKWKEIEDGITE